MIPGSNATGNVLTNDTDPNAGGTLSVSAVTFGSTAGTVGTGLAGAYGSLTLNANGSYTYVVNNTNPTVQALNTGQSLTEVFSYTAQDSASGLTTPSTLTITLNGTNDAPVVNLAAGATAQTVFTTSTRITGISITDVDGPASDTTETVTLTVTNGNLSFGNLNGAIATGAGTRSVTLTGTLAQLNAALSTLNYSSTGFTGNASLSIVANDRQFNSLTQTIALQVARNLGASREIEVKGALTTSDRTNLYQFTVNPSTRRPTQEIKIELGDLRANATLTLLDRNFNVIATSANPRNRDESIKRLLSAGTYYIRVSLDPAATTATAYELEVEVSN